MSDVGDLHAGRKPAPWGGHLWPESMRALHRVSSLILRLQNLFMARCAKQTRRAKGVLLDALRAQISYFRTV